MWDIEISFGTLTLTGAWMAAVALIGAGWWLGEPALGQLGIVSAAVGATLTVIRDNQRTRRVVRATHAQTRAADVRSLR